MNTEEKLEQFRLFLEEVVICREDLMLNAPDPNWKFSYKISYDLVRNIESEFIRTFSTEPTVKTNDTSN